MTNNAEYERLLKLYGQMIEALKDFRPSDERLFDAFRLALKLFFHAASTYHLAKGTDVTLFLPFSGHVYDHSSTAVLSRAVLETFLCFHYVFVEPQGEEFDFRYSSWKLSGFAARETFPASLPEHQAKLAEEKTHNDDLRTQIQQTQRFKDLKPKVQKQVLNGHKWRFASWMNIATSAGVGKYYMGHVYSFLSDHAHSGALSSAQITAPPNDQERLVSSDLSFIKAVVGKMITTFAHKFPTVQDTLTQDPEAAFMAEVYTVVLARLDSEVPVGTEKHNQTTRE